MRAIELEDGVLAWVARRPLARLESRSAGGWLPSHPPMGPALRVVQGARVLLALREGEDGSAGPTVDSGPAGRYEAGGQLAATILETGVPGAYWYRLRGAGPHEELAGICLVTAVAVDYWSSAAAERLVVLDEDHLRAPGAGNGPVATYASGGLDRLHIVNATRTQIFDLRMAGAELKIVGRGRGRLEQEILAGSVRLGPGERAIVEALFPRPGTYFLTHRRPGRSVPVAEFGVSGSVAPPARDFRELRRNGDFAGIRETCSRVRERAPELLVEHRRRGAIEVHDRRGDGAPGKVAFSNQSMEWAVVHATGGMFLSLCRSGVPEPALGWQDTLVLGPGESVDLLLTADGHGRLEVGFAHLDSVAPSVTIRSVPTSGSGLEVTTSRPVDAP